jgi:hypothetical protein
VDDDEDGGTFGVSVEHKEEGDEPKINYAADKSIKDLRGPAQEAIIKSSNFLIGAGVGGFIGWITLFVMFAIPVVFPIDKDEGTKDNAKPILKIQRSLGWIGQPFDSSLQAPVGAKKEKENVSLYQFMGNDFRALVFYPWYTFLLLMTPILFGMVYTSLQTFGVVRAQNLESRPWGIAASIMAMIPISIGGLSMVVCMFISFLFNMIVDEQDTVNMVVYGASGLIALAHIVGGALCLKVLMQEDVIKGFEYVPDGDDVKVKKKKKPKRKKE